jgi:hypothetical protein
MIGNRFHKWTVLGQIKTEKPGKWYECLCECGNIRIKAGTELRAGRGKQCTDCQYEELYDPDKMIGLKFGKWTVIRYVDTQNRLQRFEAQCDCGEKSIQYGSDLRRKVLRSTQCIKCKNKKNAIKITKHGLHKTPLYKVWCSMLQRCRNPNNKGYKYYGGRGIKVCKRWSKFQNFLTDMGDRPEGMTIERVNNDGDYKPSNCKWVSHKENCNNRRNKKIVS